VRGAADAASGVPHLLQNAALSGLALPQLEQNIERLLMIAEEYICGWAL
jgi:hypothetical protein